MSIQRYSMHPAWNPELMLKHHVSNFTGLGGDWVKFEDAEQDKASALAQQREKYRKLVEAAQGLVDDDPCAYHELRAALSALEASEETST